MSDTRLYIMRTVGDNVPYDDFYFLSPIGSHVEWPDGSIVPPARWQRMEKAQRDKLTYVTLFELDSDEVERLSGDKRFTLEPAQDGRFFDQDHNEMLHITENGTQWES